MSAPATEPAKAKFERTGKAFIKAENLVKKFPVRGGMLNRVINNVHAVTDVSFTIAQGETLGVVGESGCGKSTLGKMVIRLLEPTSGKVFLDGKEITGLDHQQMMSVRRRMQIIFQDPYSSLNPRLTVRSLLKEAIAHCEHVRDYVSREIFERILESEVDTFAGPARAITYATPWDPMQHLAIVFGDIRDGRDVPVRLHLESVVDDVFEGSHLRSIVDRIAKGGRGVVIYLREGSVGVSRASERPRPMAGEDHGSASVRSEQWREIGLGAQILNDLGVSTIRLVTSRERHYVGLSGYGIDITSTEIIEA